MGNNSIVGAVTVALANLCVSKSIPGTGFNTWIIDTGASDHMTYDANFFDELSSNIHDPYISSANGLPSPITGEGTISLTLTMSLFRALLVPNIHCNLLSVGRLLYTLNASATFYLTDCSFQDLKTHKTIEPGKRIRGLYYLTLPSTPVCDRVVDTVQSCSVKDKHQIWLWHRRFGHLSFGYLKHLFSSLFRSCDEFSFYTRVKVFWTDNGGEYVNNTLTSFFHAQVIIHQITTPFTPQQNDVSERKNRQLLEVARSLMLDMSVPHHLWGHAVLSATYLINRTLSPVLDFKTLHDVFGDHVSPIAVSKLPIKFLGGLSMFISSMEYCSREGNDRSPIYEDETCGLCEETIGRPLELDWSPLSGDEACALSVEMTCRIEGKDLSHVSKNSNSDSCVDESDAIPHFPCQCPNLLVTVNQVR
ncbi:hypothetical protein L3X38_016857 [Prunus dulcis]|uniref:Integrase catalytic domain-containing protein n=1 Tax=Prunus dulcis TaxID=3755 RepID=A0AAD4W6Q6_PRUDU|nr:hypothetical protein L3X38_016857 [Prunus dulcis]